MEAKEYNGQNGTLILTDTAITIKRGAKGFIFGGGFIRGEKNIPYSSIVAVQLKKAGMTIGYIQFTLIGGSDAKGGLLQSVKDENSVSFQPWKGNNERFEEAKMIVEEKMAQSKNKSPIKSDADELEKLAALKEKGILTDEEFQAKKKQLLGI